MGKQAKKWTGRLAAGVGVVAFSVVSLGATGAEIHNIKDLQVPITVIGAVLLVAGPKLWEYITGSKKDEKKELLAMQLHLSRIDNKLDNLVSQRKEDHEEHVKFRDEIQRVQLSLSHEVGRLYTAIAERKDNAA